MDTMVATRSRSLVVERLTREETVGQRARLRRSLHRDAEQSRAETGPVDAGGRTQRRRRVAIEDTRIREMGKSVRRTHFVMYESP